MTNESPALTTPSPSGEAPADARRTRPWWVRELPILIPLLITVVLLGHSTVHRAAWSRTHRSDFTVYTAAAEAFLHGRDIYEAKNPRGWMYMYLPVFAVAVVPFTWVSIAWAAGIWYALSVAMLAHMLWLSADLAKRLWPASRLSRFHLSMLALLGILWPSISGLARGQASVLVAYLVTLAIWAMLSDRRNWLAGGTLAGAIVLKVFPILFLAYLALRRRWWPVLLTTGVWLLLLVFVLPGLAFGFRENVRLLHRWVTTVAMSANQPDESENQARYDQMIDPRIERNQSLSAVFIRLIAPDDTVADATGRENFAERIAKALGLAMVLATAWACFVPRRNDGTAPAAAAPHSDEDGERADTRRTLVHLCLGILLMLLISPVSWVHSYALLALPLAIVAAAAAAAAAASLAPSPAPAGPPRLNRWAWGYIVFLIASALALTVWQLRIWGALLWGAVALWALVVTSREPRPRGAPPSVQRVRGAPSR